MAAISPDKNSLDPLDSVLDLETQYHTEGFTLGVTDGTRAGLIEGRLFGLEKGLEKFNEMGRLNGRAAVWSARLAAAQCNGTNEKLKPLKGDVIGNGGERLRRHIQRLIALTDPETLETANTEDAVAEFDERLKEGRAKAVVVSRVVGEDGLVSSESSRAKRAESSVARGRGRGSALRVKGEGREGRARPQTGEMEDFAGLPGARKKGTMG